MKPFSEHAYDHTFIVTVHLIFPGLHDLPRRGQNDGSEQLAQNRAQFTGTAFLRLRKSAL